MASNLLEVEVIVIPAFHESGCDPVRGITKIQPLSEARHDPLYMFAFSDSDFISPHYESVWPKDPTFPPTFLPFSILPPSIAIEDTEMLGEIKVTDVINLEDTEIIQRIIFRKIYIHNGFTYNNIYIEIRFKPITLTLRRDKFLYTVNPPPKPKKECRPA